MQKFLNFFFFLYLITNALFKNSKYGMVVEQLPTIYLVQLSVYYFGGAPSPSRRAGAPLL